MKDAPRDVLKAVQSGDAETLAARLPALGEDVDAYGHDERPLVEWAAIEGQVESLRALIKAGSKPTSIPNILHTCIFSGWGQGGDVSFVAALLDAGCDVNQREEGDSGATPLYTAAMTAPFADRSAAATKLLLDRGADPNVVGSAAARPLHVAASGISAETVRLLLEAGADANARDAGARTPAHYCLEALGEASAHADGDEDDPSVETAIQLIEDNLTLLLAHGADLSLKDDVGQTPLEYAIFLKCCPEHLVTRMLDGGAPADIRVQINDDELDLLAVATLQEYSPEMFTRFYDAGCPVDQGYAIFGDRPFLEIATQFRPDIALVLCRHSSGFVERLVAHKTAKGTNALACAAVGGSRELVDLLLEKGLSPTEANEEGNNAIDFAELSEHEELAAYLRSLC